jgi:hypothetical protein
VLLSGTAGAEFLFLAGRLQSYPSTVHDEERCMSRRSPGIRAAGAYALEPLLGETPAAPLTVGDGGSVSGYAPLPVLAPHTGYIFQLTQ